MKLSIETYKFKSSLNCEHYENWKSNIKSVNETILREIEVYFREQKLHTTKSLIFFLAARESVFILRESFPALKTSTYERETFFRSYFFIYTKEER